ncbi:MAG: efflux RND transporter periplasmic adaptor subunit [Candidatus Aminicenantes bacterium]|nr:efflux RND transporter periplasmic adaptor subunit [Candidatus Aminicenantes bacterium]NIM80391.1 efflux RND transporter periplasmic adaptor subunit [Candidatus Aminicenantes bacterium]NIN19778.1 efflux RND transporter periplasmic adaptor subunit [Candidatus Aminicenantes bacterium]NIN43660.1 efflux RND transporter periplasmic adaptor subunit [Candidatus Aminicenantes bacterium]NIN86405.1 efflux RND transporter periplasmic adaptor subunit [Candidatus Aminicenantes bacterium]
MQTRHGAADRIHQSPERLHQCRDKSYYCHCGGKKKEQPKEDIIPVKIVPVTRQELAIPIYTSGQLYPKEMVKLSFKVGGIIEKLHAEEGENVKKGELLASLDLSEIQAHYNQARNAWQKAQRDLKRVKNLYNDRAATLEQLQNVETAFAVAESNLKIAKFNLDYSRIKAPANGKILKRLTEEGEIIGVGMPVFLFGSTEDQWVIKVGVSERDIVRIALRDTASVRFDAYPGKEFTASVTEISHAIDRASGTYEVELSLDNGEEQGLKLAAGFVGKARIEPSARGTYFMIPVDSIVEGEGDEGIVFTIKDNKAVRVNVNVAHIFPETVAVRSGLEGINNVVTSGAAYLRGGSVVKVMGGEK